MPAREVLRDEFGGARAVPGSAKPPSSASGGVHPCLSFLFPGLFVVDVLPVDVFEMFGHPDAGGELARHRGGGAVV